MNNEVKIKITADASQAIREIKKLRGSTESRKNWWLLVVNIILSSLSLLLLAIILLFSSCIPTYKAFVTVQPLNNVPRGAMDFVVMASEDRVKDALQSNTIMFVVVDGGLQTEEILIDEATRARFNVYRVDGGFKVVPYWGITDRVKADMTTLVGYGMASTLSTNDWKRVIYEPTRVRSKMVFDYAVGVFKTVGEIKF